MLDTQNRQSPASWPVENGPSRTLPEIVGFIKSVIRRQWWLILLATALALAAGATYVATKKPTYAARATLIADRSQVRVQLGGVLTEVPIEVESQVQLIRSEAVALDVAKRLRLAEDPEFTEPPAGVSKWLSNVLVSAGLRSAPANPDRDPLRRALSTVLENLSVTRTGYVIDIEYRSANPERAAMVANAFANSYIDDQSRSKREAALNVSASLKNQIEELRKQSMKADEAVVQFKAQHTIVSSDGKLIEDQVLTLLNGQLITAREKTAEARARLDRTDALIKADRIDGDTAGVVSEALVNPVVVKLRTQYLDLANREAEWVRRFGAKHLAVANLRREMRDIRASINDELLRIGQLHKSEFEIAKQRQVELEKALADAVTRAQHTSQALTSLRDLESAADTYRALYRASLQRGPELLGRQMDTSAEARVITQASRPATPTGPRDSLVLMASAIAGLMLGFGAGAARSLFDRAFRTAAQVEAALDAPCLALAPEVVPRRANSKSKRANAGGEQPASADDRTLKSDASAFWTIIAEPFSQYAETLRRLRSKVQLRGGNAAVKILGVTSSVPQEGKSTIAASLALVTAQFGAKTILVDCDLRNPGLSSRLSPKAEKGLLEVIENKNTLEQVVWNDPVTGLHFLPAVVEKSVLEHSCAIMASASLRKVVDDLRRQYDYVILDLPPVAAVSDVHSTGGLVDSYLFVLEWGRTSIDMATHALRDASVVQENLLGVVLNKVDFSVLRQYQGYGTSYYAREYCAEYKR